MVQGFKLITGVSFLQMCHWVNFVFMVFCVGFFVVFFNVFFLFFFFFNATFSVAVVL